MREAPYGTISGSKSANGAAAYLSGVYHAAGGLAVWRAGVWGKMKRCPQAVSRCGLFLQGSLSDLSCTEVAENDSSRSGLINV